MLTLKAILKTTRQQTSYGEFPKGMRVAPVRPCTDCAADDVACKKCSTHFGESVRKKQRSSKPPSER